MDAVQNSPNIAKVFGKSIAGDPVHAGMSDGWLAAVAPVFAVQVMRGPVTSLMRVPDWLGVT